MVRTTSTHKGVKWLTHVIDEPRGESIGGESIGHWVIPMFSKIQMELKELMHGPNHLPFLFVWLEREIVLMIWISIYIEIKTMLYCVLYHW